MNRCPNCYRYPFCDKIKDSNSSCHNFKSKLKELYSLDEWQKQCTIIREERG